MMSVLVTVSLRTASLPVTRGRSEGRALAISQEATDAGGVPACFADLARDSHKQWAQFLRLAVLHATSADSQVNSGPVRSRSVWLEKKGLSRHGVAGAIAGLTQRTHVRFARAHNEIEPRSRDTPVGFLIRSHVVVVVPRQMLSCPIGIEVSAFVYAMVADRAVPDGGGEERRNGQEWQMSGGKHGETQRLFALGMPAPNGALVVRIPKTMTT